MKILIVSQYFWPEQFRINDLVLGLQQRGHQVSVLTGMPNYPTGQLFEGYQSWRQKRRECWEGIPIYRVPLFVRRKSKGWQLLLNFFSFALSASICGAWLLRRQSFDVVFAYEPSPVTVGIPALLMRKLKKAPMLFWVQDLWPESLSATGAVHNPFVLSAVQRMVKWIYSHCDKILVQSKGFVDAVVQTGGDRKRIHYFPNWAEALYQPMQKQPTTPEGMEIPKTGFIFMFAGNLGEAQSLDTLIEAAEYTKQHDIHWVFLGDGRKANWMKAQIAQRQLTKVHLLGRRPIEKMPIYFSLADVMLVSLCSDPTVNKTIPGKVQSYLACGRPILGALDGEGAKVILESKAGFTVAAGDAKGLAAKAIHMSKLSQAELQSLGGSAHSFYQNNFERHQLINQLEQWMLNMAEQQ